jgi:MYXO-CTERM domain-containing protein
VKRLLLTLTLMLALLASGGRAHAFELETLRESGPADKRFNIAVLGDGYRTQDQAKLKTDAQGITDYLFGVSPLKQYAKFFNVRLIHVISNEAGADDGAAGGQRDTALNSYFNCGGIDRLLCVDEGAAQVIAADDMPEFNFIIVIVNDSKYGGSGGTVCATSANEQSFEVVAHEVGHSLAQLADEYSYDGGIGSCNQQQDCSEANATVRSQRDQIKWQDWLEQATPVPTPATDAYRNAIGVFEGARYQETGTYRPKISCKMRDLGSEFCSVCAEQFVRSFWSFDNIRMIEATLPEQSSVQMDSCDPITLSATTPPITPSTYRYTWTVDGQVLPEMTSQVQLQPGTLEQGSHDIDLLVEDATELVRTDPNNLLKDQHSWTVTVSRSDCVVGSGGMGGTAGASGGAAGTSGASSGGAGDAGGAAGSGGAANAGAASVAGAPGMVGSTGGTGTTTMRAPPPQDTAGCGCGVPGSGSPLTGTWALLALGLVVRLRHRSNHSQHAGQRRVAQLTGARQPHADATAVA